MGIGVLCGMIMVMLGGVLGLNPSSFPNSQVIMPGYTVYWAVDEVAGSIVLALDVQTTGWVGFGIAEITSGSMPGADIVIGSVVDGVGSISDRWSSEYALPNIDDCQDWFLVSASEENGNTTIIVKRALDTKDAQDRVIVPGPNRIIVAFGADGVDTPSYHQGNRVTSQITFYGSSPYPPLPSDAKSIDLLIHNFTVPDGETHYICQSFSVPTDQDYYIVQMDPIIEPSNVAHLHHFLLFVCSDIPGGFVQNYTEAGACQTPLGDQGSGCEGLLMAWAEGGGPTYLPKEAGFPMGRSSTQYVVIQIHYNNPDDIGRYIDHSGARLWYTTQKRQYDAAVMWLADPGIQFDPIPPNTVKEYESECPSWCTQSMPQDIQVFQSFPHMHQVGAEIWTTQWRDNTLIDEIGRVEFWSFNHQQSQPINVTIKQGDRLNTHCVYNTTGKNTTTNFGIASTDEMCIHFLSYYPKIVQSSDFFCGYLSWNMTVCGDWEMSHVKLYDNPTVYDPAGGANRTFGVEGPCESPVSQPAPLQTSVANENYVVVSPHKHMKVNN